MFVNKKRQAPQEDVIQINGKYLFQSDIRCPICGSGVIQIEKEIRAKSIMYKYMFLFECVEHCCKIKCQSKDF